MPGVTKLPSCAKSASEPRAVLGPGGNRVRVSEEAKRDAEGLKSSRRSRKQVTKIPESVVTRNVSVDSTCSSDSSSSNSSAKKVDSRRTARRTGFRPVKIVPDGVDVAALSLKASIPPKRCEWITPNSGKCI